MRPRVVLLSTVLLAGCARFESRPLHPEQTAAQFEARNLSEPALKTFLETNLHRPLPSWPLTNWDEQTLTLVAFYFQPSLDVARADWRVLAAGSETAAERPNPTVTVSGAHEPVPEAPSPWIPAVIFDLPIETMGKRRLRIDQAKALSESARLNLATAAWQVRSRVRASLLDLVVAQDRVQLLQEQVNLRQEWADRLEKQFQAGEISAFERDTVRLTLLRGRADLADAQRLLAEARPRLADALGVPAAALEGAHFQLDLAAVKAAENLTSAEARRRALLERTDVLAALADYAASQSALQLEVAKQYPDIHLAPGYSWNAGSTGEQDWQIGATVELPLLNRHRGPIAEAAAKREASAARFRALQAKVIGDLETAVASFRASVINQETLDRLTAAQQIQQQAVASQFQAGAVDRLEVLAAEVELNATRLARLDAYQRLQAAVGTLEEAIQRPLTPWPALEQNPRLAGKSAAHP